MIRIFLIIPWLILSGAACGQLQKFAGCTLVANEWADGDSFEVRFEDGKTRTLRLYGADCLEMHVQGDDSNARRLRDQRRYFGIADILAAKAQGEAAKAATLRWLAQPFTVHTAFADGRGDDRSSRVYAFVMTANGENLAELLVAQGLARAFGVVRQLPNGTAGEEWREQLKDLELTAARASRGAWALTDWEQLPKQRMAARGEIAELTQAKGKAKAVENRPVDINGSERALLMTLPGVGEKTADLIIGGRPFRSLEELTRVRGISAAKLEILRPFLTLTAPGARSY